MVQQHLLIGDQLGLPQLLPIATQLLAQNQQVTLLAQCSTTKSIMQVDGWFALKNQYLAQLSLLFFTDQQRQTLSLFSTPLDRDTLARLIPGVWQPELVEIITVAGSSSFFESMIGGLAGLGVDPTTVNQLPTVDAGTIVGALDVEPSVQPQVQVSVQWQGREYQFAMSHDGSTVLDAAEDAGLDLPFSCRGGVCSTCRTKVTKGQITMLSNDSLDDWELEQGFVLACQAVPQSSVLHLDYDQT